jgi:hypothetical protein
MRGTVRLANDSDQALAWVALTFASVMLVVEGLFQGSPWRADLFAGWQFLVWTATALVVAMAGFALHHLASGDRTVPGSLLALVALLHAPVHAVLVFGLADSTTTRELGALAAWALYPLLVFLSAVVILRPVLRRRLALTPHEER